MVDSDACNHLQKQVEASICVTMEMVKDALDQLRGAVMIVYPMGLPPYDPIRMEFENKEDLSGTQVRDTRAFCARLPPLESRSPSDLTVLSQSSSLLPAPLSVLLRQASEQNYQFGGGPPRVVCPWLRMWPTLRGQREESN